MVCARLRRGRFKSPRALAAALIPRPVEYRAGLRWGICERPRANIWSAAINPAQRMSLKGRLELVVT